ncbi:iron ABC transporter permease [Robertmurraya sp. FSL W8-0741]|uniref:FecCD family ABC transporter permease n=1 Tax=Robertmurraya sp. FSL W8-0741 TaxID=2954629 RepID=UPI0030F5F393
MKDFHSSKHRKQYKMQLFLLFCFLIICFVVSFHVGRYPIHPIDLVKVLFSNIVPIEQGWDPSIETVLYQIRMPRVIGAVLVGAALSCAGAVYQGLFQNPMCSPDLLGASSGAGFGAALAILFHLGFLGTTLFAFCFGVITVLMVYLLSRRVKGNPTLGLILTGIMVGSLFSAAISFIKLVADPNDTLPAITYWLMGSLSGIGQKEIWFCFIPILAGVVPLLFLRWKLNVMTMGEEEAKAMGINTKFIRLIVIICATMLTSASVAVSGMIGWVGLVIPHFTRMITGPDFRRLIPASMILGASFMLIVDNFSRMLTTQEIPLGILTAFIGAPFFIYLIMREGNKS